MTETLLSNNISNYFKFIMTPTRGKHLWSLSQKWNNNSTFTKDCRQYGLVNSVK